MKQVSTIVASESGAPSASNASMDDMHDEAYDHDDLADKWTVDMSLPSDDSTEKSLKPEDLTGIGVDGGIITWRCPSSKVVPLAPPLSTDVPKGRVALSNFGDTCIP